MPIAQAFKHRDGGEAPGREGRPWWGCLASPRPAAYGPHPPSRLNGSSLENDAFSDKSERENAEESDNETHDHSRKTESGSDQSEAPVGPGRRGTTYVVQDHEDLGEVRAAPPQSPHPWSRGGNAWPSPQGELASSAAPRGPGTGWARVAGLRESPGRDAKGPLVGKDPDAGKS